MNQAGGAGTGFSTAQLQNPDFQFSKMIPQFAAAYKEAKAQGLSGPAIAGYFAQHVERCASEYWGTNGPYGDWYRRLEGQNVAASVTPATQTA
jgi:hypothetical protein